MARRAPTKYTPEQEIINLRAKGAITPREANSRLRQLAKKEAVEAAAEVDKAERSVLRRVLDFFTP